MYIQILRYITATGFLGTRLHRYIYICITLHHSYRPLRTRLHRYVYILLNVTATSLLGSGCTDMFIYYSTSLRQVSKDQAAQICLYITPDHSYRSLTDQAAQITPHHSYRSLRTRLHIYVHPGYWILQLVLALCTAARDYS
jgi:hypothetical protein